MAALNKFILYIFFSRINTDGRQGMPYTNIGRLYTGYLDFSQANTQGQTRETT